MFPPPVETCVPIAYERAINLIISQEHPCWTNMQLCMSNIKSERQLSHLRENIKWDLSIAEQGTLINFMSVLNCFAGQKYDKH